ncbi:hypothetical protein AF72_03580 [Xylella taiwanensis]|uniref:Uncharacterized protein n=1 Tax=Xylella taiwanensis TaxID=1444770 RepID=Z9JLL9_9GAMM|nr:hypothetical protein AB672_03300 [Xylella taiwanensis]EWS78657.1 hypothetical protein AF72_03580 [Xylella taiwanensis]
MVLDRCRCLSNSKHQIPSKLKVEVKFYYSWAGMLFDIVAAVAGFESSKMFLKCEIYHSIVYRLGILRKC